MNNVSPINTALKYGAINGLATFAFFILLYALGKNPMGSWSVLGWFIPVVFTVIAIRNYRNKDLGGYITYGQGLGAGLLVSIFSGFLVAVLVYSFISIYATNIPQMHRIPMQTWSSWQLCK